MKRRPNGAGSISRTRNKLQVRVPLADGTRRTVAMFEAHEIGEASEMLHAVLEELANTELTSVGGLTLTMFGRRWLTEREVGGDVRDVQNELGRFELHVAKVGLGGMPLRAITALDVAAWYRALRAKKSQARGATGKISRKTVSEVVRIVKAIFRAACTPEYGSLLTSSPAEWIQVKRELRTEEPWDYLRSHEIDKLREADIEDVARWLIFFAIGTGLRLGEMMNLELRDLIVDGPRPEVVVRFGSKGQAPKNGRIRRVPLFGLGLEAARAWLALLPRFAPGNPEGLVFPTSRGSRRQPGKHLHASRWDAATKRQIKVDRFKEVLAAAGIDRPIRWHDLRHTCASMLVSGGWGRRWTLEETRELMGHLSLQSTQRYAHLADSALRRAATETHDAMAPVPLNLAPDAASSIGCKLPTTEGAKETKTPIFVGCGSAGTRTLDLRVKSPARWIADPHRLEGASQLAASPLEVLLALARGDADAARAGGRELALRVLDSELVRLARQVLEGGEFVDARVVELCEAMLAQDGAAKRGAA